MVALLKITNECLQRISLQSNGVIDVHNDIIYCQIFETGDYWQAFTIVLLMFMIYLGMCLLPFTKYASYAKAIHDNRSTLLSRDGLEDFQSQMNDKQERDLAMDRYNGIPFHLYLIIHALLSIIYALIKIILVFNIFGDESDNRYQNVNARFKEDGFKSFVNAETIILTYLITHNISNIKQLTGICRSRCYSASDLLIYTMWICICLIWIDVILSFGLLCYKWSLLIFFLYQIAVAIIYILGFMLSCCCIIPAMICVIVLILSVFTIFGTDHCLGRFIMGIGSALTVGILGYFALCAMLCLVFAIVGGPHESIIYFNLNDPNHKTVVALFVIATIIGLISVILGMFYQHKDSNNNERQSLNIGQVQYV